MLALTALIVPEIERLLETEGDSAVRMALRRALAGVHDAIACELEMTTDDWNPLTDEERAWARTEYNRRAAR